MSLRTNDAAPCLLNLCRCTRRPEQVSFNAVFSLTRDFIHHLRLLNTYARLFLCKNISNGDNLNNKNVNILVRVGFHLNIKNGKKKFYDESHKLQCI